MMCGKRAPGDYTAATCTHDEGHDGGCTWTRGGFGERGPQRTHRGLSKAESKLLSVRLPDEAYERLKVSAEREFRSATGQAAWIINQWLEQQQ